jgi:hypothetical protein
MGSQPQKTQGPQFFLTRGFCRVFNADHFGKKNSRSPFFFHAMVKIVSKPLKIQKHGFLVF